MWNADLALFQRQAKLQASRLLWVGCSDSLVPAPSDDPHGIGSQSVRAKHDKNSFMFFRMIVVTLIAFAVGCSPEPENLDTYVLDLSRFAGGGDDSQGGAAWFANESLAFRPDLDAPVKLLTSEGDTFRKIYNRLPCQRPDRSTNEQLATQGFARQETEHMAAQRPVQLASISLVKPDGRYPGQNTAEICIAFHTSDGMWHGRFEPVAMPHDDAAQLRKATLLVNADNVDIIGLVIYSGHVSTVSFVARPQ